MTKDDNVATACNMVTTHNLVLGERGYTCTTCDVQLSWADLAVANKSEKDFINTWTRLGITGICPRDKG